MPTRAHENGRLNLLSFAILGFNAEMSHEMELKYWALVNYSDHVGVGNPAHRALESYRVPHALVGRHGPAGKVPKRVMPVFRDRDELPGAPNLAQRITNALSQSRYLIVICSPRSAVSRYVNEEIRTFQRMGGADRILCVVVDGEPGASKHPESGLLEAFPEAVRFDLDGQAVEPLAADARANKDGKANAKLKVLAGILGVEFDELKRRESRRRRWRVVEVAALVAGVASIVAAVWWDRQKEATTQHLIAEARRAASESLEVPERESKRRIELALQSVKLTRQTLGYALPEAEIALYRALTQSALRGEFSESDQEPSFGGWTWPVAINRTGDRIVVPAAVGPTLILDGRAKKVATLTDPDQPYKHDYVVRLTTDGTRALTGGADGVVRLWTLQGELIERLRAHASDVLTIDQSVDGELVLTVGCDEGSYRTCTAGSARLWNRAGKKVSTFSHGGARVIAAALSPDASRVMTTDEFGTVGFWSASGTPLFKKSANSFWVADTSFSPDGRLVIAGGCNPFFWAGQFSPMPRGYELCPGYLGQSSGEVQILDQQGRVLQKMSGRLAKFDSLGTRFMTATESCNEKAAVCRGKVQVRQVDGRLLTEFEVGPGIVDLDFSPDGQFVVVANEEGTVTMTDATGRGAPFSVGTVLHGLTSVQFSGNGARLVTVSCPNQHQGACLRRAIHIWDPNGSLVETRLPMREPDPIFSDRKSEGFPPIVRFGSSSPTLLVATNDGNRPIIWDLKTDQMSALQVRGDLIADAAFNADDTRLLTIGQKHEKQVLEEQRVQLWDIRTGRSMRLLEEYREDIRRVPAEASPRLVAAGGGKGAVQLWNWDGTFKAGQISDGKAITWVDVSFVDDAIVTAHSDGRVWLWDAKLRPIGEIDASVINAAPEGGWIGRRFDLAYRVRFTPDGNRVVIVGPRNISVWDRNGRKQWSVDVDPLDYGDLDVAANSVLLVVCTERGRGLSLGSLSTCFDSRTQLWDLQGKFIGQLDPGAEKVVLVASARFNDRGNRIVTVDESGVTRLWDARGNLIDQLLGLAGAADFDPAGGRLATVSKDGVIQLWWIGDKLEAMIEEAELRLK